MRTACPSCNQPIDQDETEQRLADGTSLTRCANCGLVLSGDEATGTYLAAEPARGKPRQIGNFSLLRVLGEGGFGAVWLAEDQNLGRRVALKLPKGTGPDSKLLHEAQTAAKLRHPNIVSIYEVGLDGQQVFIASEYIDGEDLRSEIARARPTVERAVHLMATLGRAVHHAHEHAVVHRDIKPANVIINAAGEPFITDFGIAKQLSVDETISADGAVVGTVSYMSPEQARGQTRETDHRSDVYALGVMLFELLTEFRPFRGNARAVIDQKISEDPPSPRRMVPTLPKDLETICLKCLEREPSNRYQSAAEVADELDRFATGVPIKARPASRFEKAWRWCRRKPAVAALLFGFFLSLAIGMAGVTFFWREANQKANEANKSLYLARMNLAAKLWESGDIAGLNDTLDKYSSDAPTTDMRDFEWYYFRQLTEPFRQISNHGEAVSDVALSRDGSMYASTGNDRVIRVWESDTGNLRRSLSPASGKTGAIAFSPVDDRLASAHADGVVRLWNPKQHARSTKEMAHGAGLSHVRFSPDGRYLVTAGKNGAARLWRISSAKMEADLSLKGVRIRDVRFSPNGRWIAVAGEDGNVALWDTQAQQYAQRFATRSRLLCMTFASAGKTLVTGNYGSGLQVWSVESGERLHVVRLGGGAVGDIEFLAEAQLLAVATTSHNLHLVDTQWRETRSLVTHKLTHGMLAQSHDGSRLAVGSGDGSVKLLEIGALRRQDILWHDAHVRDVAVLADGKQVVTCTGDGSVALWDLPSGEKQQLVAASGREMLALALQPGGHLLAACGMSREIIITDLRTKKQVDSIALPYSGFSNMCFTPDGKRLAMGSRSGDIRVYEMSNLEMPTFELSKTDVRVNALAYSPDGRSLVALYSDGRIVFVDAADGKTVGAVTQLSANPLALAFCDSGRQIAVGTQTGDIHFLDSTTRETVRVTKAHSSRINSLALLAGGTRLVSGGRDRALALWDLPSGELVTTFHGHGRQVFAVRASSDASAIFSAGLAGDLRVWRTSARQ